MTTKEQYIHRLGRTARAGKSGGGLLLLADFEQSCMERELRDLQLHRCPLQATAPALAAQTVATDPLFGAARAASFDTAHGLHTSVGQAYQAWLGFYNSNLRKLGWSPAELVARANGMARAWGYPALPPALQRKTVGKMGLKGVPGLNIDDSPQEGGGRGGGKGGGGKGRW